MHNSYSNRGGRRPYSGGGGGRRYSRGSGGHRFGGVQRSRGPIDERINESRFINKVVITEEAERFTPEHTFQDFDIHPRLKAEITTKGYVLPTPIQDKAIPHVLQGEDVVGIANTGTGKTAAFLIPLIHKVVTDRSQKTLIVVPTRELAIQIEQELRSLTSGAGIYSVTCVGGAAIGPQLAKLRMENDFIIGTPGRLKDLIERKRINLAMFKNIVLDEADRMLDMGFVNDMRFLMAGMPKERQTLFFSATISPVIEKLISEFLKAPIRISVKTRDTSQNVEQDVVKVGRDRNKLDVLHELLTQKEFSKVLIFGRTKHGVEKLSKTLAQKGIQAESIHGNKTHSKRQQALSAFKASRIQVLVATDVAARGLDIPDVSHVINFELPATYDDYVHRIGRTGRGEKKGKALTFLG
ncbi:hypothetical protein A2841_03525 [Candidatus Kaiserbacteria bacterium RIFCSPHIGHO2_01_FULL_48_10]|uniref:RNA helicase n=1 Tax=Candidatus Kaiserbacteria bacterium RIFCSPHIGHO2_01_FULL_48_10 TaxID=1798476 RepID=A0A1F6C219_9BACT|nr:MAG: hypothetical protein A2841_03525 [Candidatus Kaiserbacteria bacterium RIFCSPHIGHO2_01_FULL_48_10]